jgi:uncharacterized tellurite resistance protein B-like protein
MVALRRRHPHTGLAPRWTVATSYVNLPFVSLLRFLGLGSSAAAASTETETVRRIAARLDELEAEEARRIAAFAYVLARVANVDLRVSDAEADTMKRAIIDEAGIAPAAAALVIEIVCSQVRQLGGAENYSVTREFRRLSTRDERLRLLRCLFAVAAAEDAISSAESTEIVAIGEEIGFVREEVIALRTEWREHIAVLRRVP